MAKPPLIIFTLAALSGCTHAPVSLSCPELVRHRLVVDAPSPGASVLAQPASAMPATGPEALPGQAAAARPAESVEAVIRQALVRRTNARAQTPVPVAGSSLYMSGGGEKGAFGAGYLAAWQDGAAGGLPDFDVVTGISTGSILATFAFTRTPALAVRGYTIDAESDLITAWGTGLTSLVKHSAAANLDPFRRRIAAELSDDVLRAVAQGDRDGRLLLVGAVDVDDGNAWGFNLTRLASRWDAARTAGDAAAMAHLKQCYVETIVASSSAPPAAPPVFINNRLYIDGGARFGVFGIGVVQAQEAAAALGAATPGVVPPVPAIYVLVNGTLTIPTQCHKVGQGKDKAKTDCEPPLPADAAHQDWSLLTYGPRSVDILQNQVYRFSVQSIELSAEIDRLRHQLDPAHPAQPFRFVKIDADVDAHPLALPGPDGILQTRSCAGWKDVDVEADKPLQFHKRYMRCLIDYGAKRSRDSGYWVAKAG